MSTDFYDRLNAREWPFINKMKKKKKTKRKILPRSEGTWAQGLAVLLGIIFMFLAAWIALGTWRTVQEAKDYSAKWKALKRLDAEIADEISYVLNLTIATNCSVVIDNATQPNQYPDITFRIYDGARPSALVAFNVSSVNSMQTVILGVQNKTGFVALLAQIQSRSSTFQDDTFAVENHINITGIVMLDVSSVSAGVIRTLTVQSTSCIIALISDIPTFGSVFLDNEFAVVNYLDQTKRAMLNCSMIATMTTRVISMRTFDGVIAYVSDLQNATGPPFSDADFQIFSDNDASARMEFDLSMVDAGTVVQLLVQDRSGIVAYLSQIVQIVEVTFNDSRIFPDMANEGVSTLSELGQITHIELTFCGGGGGACYITDVGRTGGGGSGAAVVDFTILYPNNKFDNFNVTLGAGGTNCSGPSVPAVSALVSGGTGGTTTVAGISSTGYFFSLDAYGGTGGYDASFAGQNHTYLGSGGGGGGSGSPGGYLGHEYQFVGGEAGSLGGVHGIRGANVDDSIPHPANCSKEFPGSAIFRYPWFGGIGGNVGGNFVYCNFPNHGVQGGGRWRFKPGDIRAGSVAAPSIVGSNILYDYYPHPIPASVYQTPCAGGASNFYGANSVIGGNGHAIIRYYVK